MTAKLTSEDGKACYAKRKETVEPVFGQIKDVRGVRRFMRRGLCLRGGVEAVVWHPQLAQALAAHGHAASGHAGDRLSCSPEAAE